MNGPGVPHHGALSAVLGDAPVAVVVLDRGGLVRFWNRAACSTRSGPAEAQRV
jgi:hypothetical protein